MAAFPNFSQLSIEERRKVRSSRLWCVPLSVATFIAWALSLFFLEMAIVDSLYPSSVDAWAHFVALFFLALPFGIANAAFVFPRILSFNGYDFLRSTQFSIIVFTSFTAFGIAWVYFSDSVDSTGDYARTLAVAWILFVPPALLGSAITSFRFRKTTLAE